MVIKNADGLSLAWIFELFNQALKLREMRPTIVYTALLWIGLLLWLPQFAKCQVAPAPGMVNPNLPGSYPGNPGTLNPPPPATPNNNNQPLPGTPSPTMPGNNSTSPEINPPTSPGKLGVTGLTGPTGPTAPTGVPGVTGVTAPTGKQ